MADILVVDDERNMRKALGVILGQDGHHISAVGSGREAVRRLSSRHFDVVVTDMKMDDVGGFDVLRETRRLYPDVEVIMITAFGTIELAVEAIKEGAYDYITKPFDAEEIQRVVRGAVARQTLLRHVKTPETSPGKDTYGMLGQSEAMLEVFRLIRGPDRHDCPRLRRERNGQGTRRTCDPREQQAEPGGVRDSQLRRTSRAPARKRDVRPRQRLVLWGDMPEEGLVRGGEQRDDLSRRGR
jgi:DNA-binding response OmpR family regulator